jgi:hypothetical protein
MFQSNALAPSGAGKNFGVDLSVAAGKWINDLDPCFRHFMFCEELIDAFGRAEQHRSADALVR